MTTDGVISTVAGGGPNSPGDAGPATSAELAAAMGVAVDAAGDLFIAEEYYDPESCDTIIRLRKVTPDGMITTVAGNGTSPASPGSAGNGSNGGPAVNTPVIPDIVAVDPAGNLFIVEGNFADVRKVSSDGTINPVLSTAVPYFCCHYVEAMAVAVGGTGRALLLRRRRTSHECNCELPVWVGD